MWQFGQLVLGMNDVREQNARAKMAIKLLMFWISNALFDR